MILKKKKSPFKILRFLYRVTHKPCNRKFFNFIFFATNATACSTLPDIWKILHIPLDRLYTFRILRVFFTKHTTKYETLAIHFSHFMQTSCLINTAKKPSQNSLNFRVNADPGVKCKKRKKRCEMQKSDVKYTAVHFSFFAAPIFMYFTISELALHLWFL